MGLKTRVFNREDLYKEVWEEPMVKVASRYNISNVGLKKVCKKMQIPTPWLGYWAQVKSGINITKPLLPDYDGPKTINSTYYIDEHSNNKPDSPSIKEVSEDPLYQKIYKTYSEVLQQNYSEYEKLFETFKKNMLSQRVAWLGPHKRGYFKFIQINVSEDLMERGFKNAFNLFMTLKNLKDFKIRANKRFSSLSQDKEYIHIKIKESLKQVTHTITPEEKAKSKLNKSYTPPTYDLLATGKLCVTLDFAYFNRNWKDGKKQNIEGCIPEIIYHAYHTVKNIKIRREEERLSNQRYAERRHAYHKEEAVLKALESEAIDYNRALKIYQYVDDVQNSLMFKKISSVERAKMKKWILWARAKADWLNPIIASDDPILGKKFVERFLSKNMLFEDN